MRIWFVPFEEVSNQHVLGQHKEWGLMHAMLRNPRFRVHPLVQFFRSKKPWLADLHERLVVEMDHRFDHLDRNGGKHMTPVPRGYTKGDWQWQIPYDFILYDMIDLSKRYQVADKLTPTKYKWTNRPRPEWTLDKLAKRVELNDMPVQQISWYGWSEFEPFAADAKTQRAVRAFDDKYGWLIDQWLAGGALQWPYLGTYSEPFWRRAWAE